jgi:cell division protein FtsW (lipid II flippase)
MTQERVQSRLLFLAAFFLICYALALTIAPAVRARSYQVDYPWMHWIGLTIWLLLVYLAHRQLARKLPTSDPYLLPLGVLLSGWGLLTIWRLEPSFGIRQSLWMCLATCILILGSRLPANLNFLREYKYIWLTGGLLLTALTIVFGTNPLGSGPRLWLGCCGVYFQPSEPLKFLLIVYLSAFLADRQVFLNRRQGGRLPLLPLLAPTILMCGLAMLLLLVQRDLGTATIFLLLYTVMIYLGTNRQGILAIGVLSILLAGVIGYALFDVVQLRIDAWINPWLDPSGRSYQIVQSLLAVANGGLLGRGPGMGSPRLVPVALSDFIFSAIVEETGLVGALGLIMALGMFAERGLRAALRAPNSFRRFLAAGITAHLVSQSILIIGGNLRTLPLTGVTLPFVSYGGSSLVTTYLSLLILLMISSVPEEERPAPISSLRPYRLLSVFLTIGLASLAIAAGWWAIFRGPDLLTRTDNPRRAIDERFVKRGSLLAANGDVLAESLGQPGSFQRSYTDPSLGSILGYSHPVYGQAGLEASLDPYLRGTQGNAALVVWWNHLLYGQPPPGLNVRTTLNRSLQQIADQLLLGHRGALILLNAESGEILAMASHPTFDPNRLNEDWQALVADPAAPLLNRTVQGLYPAGTSLGPFLWEAALDKGSLPSKPAQLSRMVTGSLQSCTVFPGESVTWEQAVGSGCPGALAELGTFLGAENLLDLYQNLGFYTPPQLRLPAASDQPPSQLNDPAEAALGLEGPRLNPLQAALGAATLSADGKLPPPSLSLAVQSPQSGWEVLPSLESSRPVFPAAIAREAALALAVPNQPFWQSLGSTFPAPENPDTAYTWFMGGTLPDWQGTHFSLVVVIEEPDPELVQTIGQSMLSAAIQP